MGGGVKRSRHSRRMRNPQFFVSGKRHIKWNIIDPVHPVQFLAWNKQSRVVEKGYTMSNLLNNINHNGNEVTLWNQTWLMTDVIMKVQFWKICEPYSWNLTYIQTCRYVYWLMGCAQANTFDQCYELYINGGHQWNGRYQPQNRFDAFEPE